MTFVAEKSAQKQLVQKKSAVGGGKVKEDKFSVNF